VSDAGFGKYLEQSPSRLYYWLLFRIRALLLTLGLEPKSREEADYNPSYLFTTEDFAKLRDETSALASRIAELVRQSGFEA
jgi:hypothetical protein